MLKIVIELPSERIKTGTLIIIDKNGKIIAGPFEALGKADNAKAKSECNPNRNQFFPFGDTPLGGFKGTLIKTGEGTKLKTGTYGSHGAILLNPVSGNAKIAEKYNRIYIMIHSGPLKKNGELRPTYGCIRLKNEDMLKLVNTMKEFKQSEITTSIKENNKGNIIGVIRNSIEKSYRNMAAEFYKMLSKNRLTRFCDVPDYVSEIGNRIRNNLSPQVEVKIKPSPKQNPKPKPKSNTKEDKVDGAITRSESRRDRPKPGRPKPGRVDRVELPEIDVVERHKPTDPG